MYHFKCVEVYSLVHKKLFRSESKTASIWSKGNDDNFFLRKHCVHTKIFTDD
jgi:hypothetical protein